MAKKKTSPSSVHVDIVSDFVCPWCWLGISYFDQAAKKSPVKTTLTWRPYMLDPTVPAGGVPYREYMKNKFGDGPNDRFTSMREHLEQAAPGAGIAFNFSDIPMRPNTLDAHRLMRWAQGQDKGDITAKVLFRSFFKDLKDIGSAEVLTAIADGVGLDAALVKDLLASDKDKQETMEEIAFFQNLGITGVPTFIYNGQFAVQGGQPIDTHLQALEKAASLPAPQ